MTPKQRWNEFFDGMEPEGTVKNYMLYWFHSLYYPDMDFQEMVEQVVRS